MMKQKTFSIVAMLLVGFIIFQFIFSWILQIKSQQMGAYQLANRFKIAAGAIGHPDLSPLPKEPPANGEAIALIKIPKLGLEQIVFEGNSSFVTQKGVGHVSGSAGISEHGTSILVGRRVTWGAPFNKITQLKIGDKIMTATISGIMNYKISKINASIEDLNIKQSKSILALVTSAPAGLAFNDYIVLAEAQKRPYLSTPQNRYDGKGFRQGEFNILIVFYLIFILLIMIYYQKFVDIFEKRIAWTLIFPTFFAFFILFVRELDKLMPPTL